jgi:hypothetical protein
MLPLPSLLTLPPIYNIQWENDRKINDNKPSRALAAVLVLALVFVLVISPSLLRFMYKRDRNDARNRQYGQTEPEQVPVPPEDVRVFEGEGEERGRHCGSDGAHE